MTIDPPHHIYAALIGALWIAWGLYWWLASFGVKPAVRRESVASRMAHILPMIIGAWMLIVPALPGHVLSGRILPQSAWWPALGVVVLAAGLLFTVWARRVLGGNWSGTVTLKAGHELVRSGPYRYVRHPIYTGLLLGYVGCALAVGEWRGVVACLIVAAGFWRKLKLEERWMIETFGDGYRRYRGETAALIPFLL